MKCPKCGSAVNDGQLFCGTCGAALSSAGGGTPGTDSRYSTQQTGAGQAQYAYPIEATGGNPNAGRLLIVAAAVAGLLLGAGVVVWRMHRAEERPDTHAQTTSVTPPTPPMVDSESKARSVTPPPENDTVERARPKAREDRKPRSSAAVSKTKENAERVEPPQLLSGGPVKEAPAPSQPSGVQPPAAVTNSDTPKRRAVQETDVESPPMPSGAAAPAQREAPASDSQGGFSKTSAEPPPVTQVPSEAPRPRPQPVPKYNGPASGVATWTGKLEKGQVLTITGGTPSTGVLSGVGLPGVPVRITVDQSNLGFEEMPSSANGYRTVKLKSHTKHDRITIRWTVMQ